VSKIQKSIRVRFLALLALGIFSSAIAEPSLDASATSFYLYKDGKSTTYSALGTQLSLELSIPERPFSAGIFAEFELTTRRVDRYGQLLGSWASYRYGRWQLSTIGAHYDSNGSSGQWLYASKLQFEVRPGHKLALTAFGPIGRSSDPALRLVYKTVVAGRASLSISIGLGSQPLQDFGATTKFNWNLY